MAHPDVVIGDEGGGGAGIWVRYPEVEGVPPRIVARLCRAACERDAELCRDGLPRYLRDRLELPGVREALRQLHLVPADLTPEAVAALGAGDTQAHRRLVFDEFFFLQLGLARRRARWRRDRAPALPKTADPLAEVRPCRGFAPTGAQERAAREIAADLGGAEPMNRLLQGDVGSGKTVVAFAAALLVARAGCQSALMAPTEILAEQHLRTVEPWARALGLKVALLTAQTPRGSRESILTLLAAGRLHLLIGTHALLAERVGFDRLGLVIVDEQHRFGVIQRLKLLQKGRTPDVLVMTATPIPRTVTLTLFGDLEISTLRDSPPGRQKVNTYHATEEQRARWWEFLRRKLREGRQAYVVVPLVEESDQLNVANVQEAYESLTNGELEAFRLGLIHGRMTSAEKDAVMDDFRRGQIQVLVCTSVVEVGVDVPNATLMTIEGGERFGLAQLHQLRGRISRGSHPGFCCVFADPQTEESQERLKAFVSTTDGFKLAETDFRLRGPGEILGTRQHGLPPFRIADLVRDEAVVIEARRDAQALVSTDPDLSQPPHAALRRMMLTRYGELLELSDVG
ncbi:MAG: ATP-dependent DNA helicase RecG [Verrucomicrobia bacterium]|nr:ATP-dependent DNA helicase RecG [Verrucomicrobiota bacterium]